MVTDRPDRTESTSIVQPGYVQLEIGWTHAESDEPGADFTTDSFPELLARIGMTPRLELRVGFGGYQWADADVSGEGRFDESGAADSSLGVKLHLADEGETRPEMALLAATSLPTGASAFTSDQADPFAGLLVSKTLSDRFSLGANLGVGWGTVEDGNGDEDTLSRAVWTAALGIGLTERLGTFVELYGDAALSDSGRPANAFDTGLTWLVRPNLQLDCAAGFGISDAAEDWFLGVGVSWRLPE